MFDVHTEHALPCIHASEYDRYAVELTSRMGFYALSARAVHPSEDMCMCTCDNS